MPRKLKTYQTSQGFFDLAVAAPSMKAALQAWGSDMNLFHKGFAFESGDPKIIDATMAKPGVVLRRAVGSKGCFSENAALPSDLPVTGETTTRRGRAPKPKPAKAKSKRVTRTDDKSARKAALDYERQERQRDRQRRRQAAADARKRAKREQATAKAQAALEDARQNHEAIAGRLEQEREAIDNQSAAEENRWSKVKDRLQAALRKASR